MVWVWRVQRQSRKSQRSPVAASARWWAIRFVAPVRAARGGSVRWPRARWYVRAAVPA